ncbi:hypothetical protein BD289DRAFT_443089 [Coniella lustricola]|uniref:Uncharacterized protein n=1 Tax=Coniella lustricola TaxID=2025994 RepID=A0A2T2ZXG1_9PEZI|nr:hypothetical protein BD289DRAFT_443089 [Coniella lustricola]
MLINIARWEGLFSPLLLFFPPPGSSENKGPPQILSISLSRRRALNPSKSSSEHSDSNLSKRLVSRVSLQHCS